MLSKIQCLSLHFFGIHIPWLLHSSKLFCPRIPFSVQQTLWHELDSRLQHPEPGLLLGRNLTLGPFSVLRYLLQSSATLGDALNTALRYQRLGGEGGERHIETRDDSLD